VTNDLPSPKNDTVNTHVNRAVKGNVLANDKDGNSDSLSVVLNGTAPSHGTVVLNEDGSFTYTPDEGYIGEDSFTYEVTDGQLDGTGNPVVITATVTVHVTEVTPMSPVAPGLERREIDYSGCPALVKWVALELGVDESNIEIWMANALASSRDIQPFETYARLRTAAVILKDSAGAHIRALTQVINEFASSTAPPTEEEMASIADAIASNAGADNHYGVAEEYLNALAQYISILNSNMGFSMDEAVEFATANYVNQLTERGNANVAAYVMARLAEL
jgi:VCBS repeat-containing protein